MFVARWLLKLSGNFNTPAVAGVFFMYKILVAFSSYVCYNLVISLDGRNMYHMNEDEKVEQEFEDAVFEEVQEPESEDEEKLLELPDISKIIPATKGLFDKVWSSFSLPDIKIRKLSWKQWAVIGLCLIVLVLGVGFLECTVGYGDNVYAVIDTSFADGKGMVLWSPTSDAPHGLVYIYYNEQFHFLGERVFMDTYYDAGCGVAMIQYAEVSFRGLASPVSVLSGRNVQHRFENNEFDMVYSE